jgi:hypothetical protein
VRGGRCLYGKNTPPSRRGQISAVDIPLLGRDKKIGTKKQCERTMRNKGGIEVVRAIRTMGKK